MCLTHTHTHKQMIQTAVGVLVPVVVSNETNNLLKHTHNNNNNNNNNNISFFVLGMAMISEGGLMLVCPSDKCRYTFCRNCKEEWHADATCEQYKQWKIENGQADGEDGCKWLWALLFAADSNYVIRALPRLGQQEHQRLPEMQETH
jgi:hypothetical protein